MRDDAVAHLLKSSASYFRDSPGPWNSSLFLVNFYNTWRINSRWQVPRGNDNLHHLKITNSNKKWWAAARSQHGGTGSPITIFDWSVSADWSNWVGIELLRVEDKRVTGCHVKWSQSDKPTWPHLLWTMLSADRP